MNHASLLDGGWISRATFSWFDHLDSADLEQEIAAAAGLGGRRLIVSDGTYSMDGDACRLDELVAVATRHGAWVMIDDAHGMGVHGTNGVGLVDPARYGTSEVPVLVGTLGKAFRDRRRLCCGDDDLIETLVQRSRNYIYTTAMPPALAAATLASLEIVREEAWRREHLANLVERFRANAATLGLRAPALLVANSAARDRHRGKGPVHQPAPRGKRILHCGHPAADRTPRHLPAAHHADRSASPGGRGPPVRGASRVGLHGGRG